jgi:DNA-nicking Smr family endonuclease
LLLSEYPADKLDLHGMTAAQAEPRVMAASGRVVHIITGKGNRSEGAPVLPGLVRDLLDDDLTRLVREVAGLPGGGGVAVRLR